MLNTGLHATLDPFELAEVSRRAEAARRSVLTATTLAASGHPGGSFSSMEIYSLLWAMVRVDPARPRWEQRDRVVVSHGHTSPGVYGALAQAGFFPAEEFEAHFRQAGSVFEGHVERSVPGIEWSTGNLGQGLSAGVGLAIGARATGADWHTIVVMSDGEQHKGQVGEARRVAVREGLSELTVVLDWNRVQISGHTNEVMPVPIRENWEADGWRVYECDGHDVAALHDAVRAAATDDTPSVVLAHTVIGKGVSFMEDVPEFHGRGLTREEYALAMTELDGESAALEAASARRARRCAVEPLEHATPAPRVAPGEPRTYEPGTRSDNRSAWGKALVDVARANPGLAVEVFDCDLAVSVKTDAFAGEYPEHFHQFGVGEHNAATAAGALSTVPGVLSLWSDFGAFGVDEVYNQQRLNDINGAALKLAVTHCGLDVGEDGKTHQCLDYVGALRNFYGWKVIVPADPNQTDRAVRSACAMQGNVAVAMGRSKLDVLLAEDGTPLFGGADGFEYGRFAWARRGAQGCVLALGAAAGPALSAADALRAEGISIAVGVVSCPLDLDEEAMRLASAAPFLMTVEDHNVKTGLGASVAEWLALAGAPTRFVRVGVDGYQSSGAAGDLLAAAGLDANGIARRIREVLAGS